MIAWQPIETAPRDGTPILGYFPGSSDPDLFAAASISICRWREFTSEIQWELIDKEKELWKRSWTTPALFESEDGMRGNPTHWMPLPDPPKVLNLNKGETHGNNNSEA